jgi:hypothetical protein
MHLMMIKVRRLQVPRLVHLQVHLPARLLPVHLPVHRLVHLLDRPLVRLLVHPPVRPPVRPLVHPLVRPPVHPLVHLLVHLPVQRQELLVVNRAAHLLLVLLLVQLDGLALALLKTSLTLRRLTPVRPSIS